MTALLLAGCGANTSPEPDGEIIECLIRPATDYERVCTLERVSADDFVIHRPDGGFRRFVRVDDYGDIRLELADGAEELKGWGWQDDGHFVLFLTDEQYRFPMGTMGLGTIADEDDD